MAYQEIEGDMIEFKTNRHDPIGMGTAKEESGQSVLSRGLTKREYFAALAMQGLLSKPFMYATADQNREEAFASLRKEVARRAVQNADALIEELNKKGE